jgi:hypothetical protein
MRDVADAATRGYARATVAQRGGPDYFIIGTKRGGTTSLFNYLLFHPGVLGLFPQPRAKKSTNYLFKELHRGPEWYRSHFHHAGYRSLLERRLGYRPVEGEASPYYMWDPRIARLAHALNPDLKAIMLLRDPVERAFSHWQERVGQGVEPLTFEQALAAEPRRLEGELERMAAEPLYYSEAHDFYAYRARGVYQPQIENWLTVFAREQLLVLRSEDLYADVQGAFDQVCAFLGLPRFVLPTTKVFNASGRLPIPAAAREELTDFYEPINARLEAYLGRCLSWSRAS